MGVINFSKTNCQNCYACVRACPVQAIKINKGQAEIMETRCIACGQCLKVCPKNAKKVKSELDKVKNFIQNHKKIAVSIAPSFVGVFGKQSSKICHALKKLGFSFIEETVVGAELVTNHYNSYKNNMRDMTYITSCCPSVNYLIQKYYPENIPNLIPIVSPMVCHSRILKEKYGEDVKVVFIGPCLSKKLEGIDELTIDAVLTFEELISWFENEGINFTDLDEIDFDATMPQQRKYPIVGGVTNKIKHSNTEIITVDGLEDCINTLEAIKLGQFKNVFIEMSACRHSCIGGPAMPNDGVNEYERKLRVEQYSLKCDDEGLIEPKKQYNISLYKSFSSLYSPLKQPSLEELYSILNSMGKYTTDDELNCGTCGYHTCKDKAIAIYNNMAEANMCLPFMKQRAETLTNVIFDVTPNVVFMVNRDLTIREFNPAAEVFFDIKKDKAIGMPVSIVLESDMFSYVANHKNNILGKKVFVNNNQSVVIQSIMWIDYHDVMLCIIHDITEEVKKQEWMKNLKINAIDMAQQVINKQMMVAQEIASLLGETTAETKVTLTRLKELVEKEEVDLG